MTVLLSPGVEGLISLASCDNCVGNSVRVSRFSSSSGAASLAPLDHERRQSAGREKKQSSLRRERSGCAVGRP